ncbi:hypothetical protein FA95DRAFT_1609455 [Auriscalpium vulgare]|uniref:Uncharacterized protein n=1 Tax=Auriscalpium vulgare TaxID=40419 RepID=A0ACB8RHE6_9AGAM|nr:hypothetical protein FA95DRAFT_1609455 [Auriscalpium vulgare]
MAQPSSTQGPEPFAPYTPATFASLVSGNQPRLYSGSAARALIRTGAHADNRHLSLKADGLHTDYLALHEDTKGVDAGRPGSQREVVEATLGDVLDAVTTLDRIDGGFSLLLHVPGFTAQRPSASPQDIDILAYLPPREVAHHAEDLQEHIMKITDVFRAQVAYPYLLRAEEYCARSGIPNNQQPLPLPRPPPSHDPGCLPGPVRPGSALLCFPRVRPNSKAPGSHQTKVPSVFEYMGTKAKAKVTKGRTRRSNSLPGRSSPHTPLPLYIDDSPPLPASSRLDVPLPLYIDGSPPLTASVPPGQCPPSPIPLAPSRTPTGATALRRRGISEAVTSLTIAAHGSGPAVPRPIIPIVPAPTQSIGPCTVVAMDQYRLGDAFKERLNALINTPSARWVTVMRDDWQFDDSSARAVAAAMLSDTQGPIFGPKVQVTTTQVPKKPRMKVSARSRCTATCCAYTMSFVSLVLCFTIKCNFTVTRAPSSNPAMPPKNLSQTKHRQGHIPHKPRPKLSAAALAEVNKTRKVKSGAYLDAVDAAAANIRKLTDDLAEKHGKIVHKVETALRIGRGGLSRGKHTKDSAWSAYQWKEGRDNPATGMVIGPLAKLRRANYALITDEEKAQALKEHKAHLETRKKGEWVTSRSKTNDAASTSTKLIDELHALRARTGLEAMLFLVRGNSTIQFNPIAFATPQLVDFIPQVLAMDPQDLLTRMEGFAVQGLAGSGKAIRSVEDLRDALTKFIDQQLQELVGRRDIKWRFGSHWDIVSKYRVQIKGWPEHITFTSLSRAAPSKRLADELGRLWYSGDIRWAPISDEEFDEEFLRREAEIAAGTIPQRKVRKDKNMKRPRGDDDSAGKRPKKKARPSPPPSPSPSRSPSPVHSSLPSPSLPRPSPSFPHALESLPSLSSSRAPSSPLATEWELPSLQTASSSTSSHFPEVSLPGFGPLMSSLYEDGLGVLVGDDGSQGDLHLPWQPTSAYTEPSFRYKDLGDAPLGFNPLGLPFDDE